MMGAMFPASVFNAQRRYLHIAGWLAAGDRQFRTPGRDGVAPVSHFARVMLHRAFRVMQHLERAERIAHEASVRLSKVEIAPDESLDGVAVWSADVEDAIISMVAAVADLHVLANDTAMLIARASYDGGKLPESLRDARDAIERERRGAGKSPQWLVPMPNAEKELIRKYSASHGDRLSAFRNLDQHSGVLGQSAFVRVEAGTPRVVLRLPDNPEDRTRRDQSTRKHLTFRDSVDGIQLARQAQERLHAVAEEFAAGRGAARGEHAYMIDMVPVDLGQAGILHVMLDGETTWITRGIPDARVLLQRTVQR